MSEPNAAEVLHEPYQSVEQQRETATAGMWLFLTTELMFFGGLFAAYLVYRIRYPGTFHEMSHHLDEAMGTLNTAVLLTSSLTMALAVRAAKHARPGERGNLLLWLTSTLLFGIAFLAIKAKEWTKDYHEHHFPGHWQYDGPHAKTGELFFYLYYAMVGLHGLHVLIGVTVIAGFLVLAARRRYSCERYTPVEVLGLYWHFVDLIWIFLYPLFYLAGAQ